MKDYILTDSDELRHYGVKGMKWGVRRQIGKKARLYAATKNLEKQTSKTINRTQRSIEKERNKIVPNFDKITRKEKKLARYQKSQAGLKKAMNTLMKDLSEKDIKQGRLDIHLRGYGAAFLGGGGGAGLYYGRLYSDAARLGKNALREAIDE